MLRKKRKPLFWESGFPNVPLFLPFESNYLISHHRDVRAVCLLYHKTVLNPMLVGLFFKWDRKGFFLFFVKKTHLKKQQQQQDTSVTSEREKL